MAVTGANCPFLMPLQGEGGHSYWQESGGGGEREGQVNGRAVKSERRAIEGGELSLEDDVE